MTDPFTHVQVTHMGIKEWETKSQNLIAGFTTKLGGNSEQHFKSLNMGLHVNDDPIHVIENRKILADAIGFPLSSWVSAEQVHGTTIRKISSENKGNGAINMETAISAVDGIYTNEPGILLTAFYADCVPIFYFSPKHHLIGIAHAGWKGSVGKIQSNMVKHWVDNENVTPEDIYVIIGPSICQDCYEVDQRIIDQVIPLIDQGGIPYIKTSDTHYHLDLKQLNKQLLLNSGIDANHIQVTKYCTSCNNDLFFSHRKEQGKTGRMLGFIGWKE